MEKVIPIFPLKLVVFPRSSYPLHIFEERYKKLINKCLKDKTGFGIVAKTKHGIEEIGVYVEITKVLEKFENGEMDIVVTGRERFKRHNLKLHDDGYHIAEVEPYEDINSQFNIKLLQRLQKNFNRVLDKAEYSLDHEFWNHFEMTPLKSYKVAEKSGLTLEQQQKLLSIREENSRLKYLIRHFDKLIDAMDENEALRAIVYGDGYLN